MSVITIGRNEVATYYMLHILNLQINIIGIEIHRDLRLNNSGKDLYVFNVLILVKYEQNSQRFYTRTCPRTSTTHSNTGIEWSIQALGSKLTNQFEP